MRKITCACCGKTFETAKRNIKYCSAQCAIDGKRIKRVQWEKDNPGYNSRYYQEHRQTNLQQS